MAVLETLKKIDKGLKMHQVFPHSIRLLAVYNIRENTGEVPSWFGTLIDLPLQLEGHMRLDLLTN